MVAFFRFYWACFKLSLSGAWLWAWSISSIGSIAGGAIYIWSPFENKTMSIFVGLVPLAIFLAIMVAGPLVAAFRLYSELLAKNRCLEASAGESLEYLAGHIATGDLLRSRAMAGPSRYLVSGDDEALRKEFDQWSDECKVSIAVRFSRYEADRIFGAEMPLDVGDAIAVRVDAMRSLYERELAFRRSFTVSSHAGA